MKILRLPLLIASISPLLAVYRGFRAADAKVKGLLSNEEAQRQLLTNAAIAGVVYFVVAAVCLWHLAKNPRLGTLGKMVWGVCLVLVPMFALPTYILLHVRTPSEA